MRGFDAGFLREVLQLGSRLKSYSKWSIEWRKRKVACPGWTSGPGRWSLGKQKLKVLFYEISFQVASVRPVFERFPGPIVDDRQLATRFGEDIQSQSYFGT